MTFFARPNLSEEQFKQLEGTTLKLSGQTQIKTTSGLTLAGGNNENVLLTACDAATHVGHVLTLTCIGTDKIIQLMPSGAGGDQYYNPPYKSPAAITLGGVSAGTQLTGKTLSCIIETLLVPTLNPSLQAPFNTLSINPSNTIYEVGAQVGLQATATFNRGLVTPVYDSGPSTRTGYVSFFNYTAFGASCPPVAPSPSTNLSNTISLLPYTILAGNNTISSTVSYLHGEYAKDSTGADWIAGGCCANGTTGAQTVTLTGLYPWFWGKSATLPVAGQTLINTGTKVIASSAGAITVPNFGATDEYIWFAIPSTSPSRTFWQDITNTSNNGVIPGALFPTMTPVTVNSFPSGLWSSQSYKFYISGYKTSVNYGITLT
jgi:hypothetical protein